MKLTARTTRRLGVAAGAISAAILIPATALAAPARPAHTAAPAVARCATASLRAWLGIPGDGSAGAITYQLELSNISSHSCTLVGFPGVSAFGRNGQLGSAANRNTSSPSRQVVLGPRGTAHVNLSITDVGVFSKASCRPVTAQGLKVFPPNDVTATRIPFSFRACSRRGPVYLHVGPVIGGTGIPGFGP